jgi:hypothetical protein
VEEEEEGGGTTNERVSPFNFDMHAKANIDMT